MDTNTGGFHIDSKSHVLPEVDTKQVLSEAANDRERADERKADQESGGIVGKDSPVTSYWGSTFKPQNGGSSGTVTDITLDTPHTPPVASTNGKARPASKPRLAIKPGNSLNQKYEENIELESLGEETNPRTADASSSGSSTSIPQVFVTPPKDVSPSTSLMPVPAAVGRNIWNRLFGGTVTPLVVARPSAISPAFSVPAEVPDSLLPETLVGLPTLDLIPEDDFWINAWENPNPSDYVPVSGYDRKGKGKAKAPLAKRDDYGHMHSEISPMRMQQRLLGRAEIGHRCKLTLLLISLHLRLTRYS